MGGLGRSTCATTRGGRGTNHVRYGNVEPGFSSLGCHREKCVHGGEGSGPVGVEVDRGVPTLLEHEALEKGEDARRQPESRVTSKSAYVEPMMALP